MKKQEHNFIDILLMTEPTTDIKKSHTNQLTNI